MQNKNAEIHALQYRDQRWERIKLSAMPWDKALELAGRGDLTGELGSVRLFPCQLEWLDQSAIYLYDAYHGEIEWQDAVRPGKPFDSSASELERLHFGQKLASERVYSVRQAMEEAFEVCEIEPLLPSLDHVDQFMPRLEMLKAKDARAANPTIWDEASGYDSWDTAVAMLGKIEIRIAWQRQDEDLEKSYHCSLGDLCSSQGAKNSDRAREVFATLEDRPSSEGDVEAVVSGMRYGEWRRIDGLPLDNE